MYQFVLAMVLALYVGFSRLHHLRFLAREPMLMGILKVLRAATAVHLLAFLARCIGVSRGSCWKCSGRCGNEYGKPPMSG
jgi:hypothetical protein